jgi:Na+/H+ antiporter NhaA
VFFLLFGLEIKREAPAGELASPRHAALPIGGAIGGMVVPAFIYVLTNGGGMAPRGWAIPMATDIALRAITARRSFRTRRAPPFRFHDSFVPSSSLKPNPSHCG